MIFPDPVSYAATPVYDLLRAAARGYAAIDLRLIRAIIDRGEAAVPDLLRFAAGDHEDDRVDLEEDLIAIFRHLHTPAAVPFLIDCIRSQPEDVPDDIVEAILPFKEQAFEPLLSLYGELDESEASDVAFLLAGMRIHDQRLLDILLDRLEYDAGDGAFALGLYGDPAALPALERMLQEVRDEDADLRREIQFAISEIQSPRSETDSGTPKFDIAEYYPEVASPPYEVLDPEELVEMLKKGHTELRAAAAEGLRNEEIDDETRAFLFDHARNDPESVVRARCWEALADTDAPDIRAAMKRIVADDSRDPVELGGAIVGLCNATEDRQVSTKMREFYARPELRAKALEAMWRSFDRQFAGFFAKHLDDADPDVKRQAVWGTGYMGLSVAAPKLQAMFDDEEYRHDALFAYALCSPGPLSRGRVRGILRKIDALAGGLSERETEIVQVALDQRLQMHGMDPVFATPEGAGDAEEEEAPRPGPQLVKSEPKVERNDPCPCGSGKKYKKCHGA